MFRNTTETPLFLHCILPKRSLFAHGRLLLGRSVAWAKVSLAVGLLAAISLSAWFLTVWPMAKPTFASPLTSPFLSEIGSTAANRSSEIRVSDASYDDRQAYFETYVRPLLAEHCYSCHSAQAEKVQANLRLDHGEWLKKGGDSGSAIEAGNAQTSLLMQAVRYESFEMPPQGRLEPSQVAILEKWINDGAYWPEEPLPETQPAAPAFDWQKRREEHWAWQAVVNPLVPHCDGDTFSRSPLDCFVFEKAQQHVRSPNAQAERHVLVRRLYLDLIGVPPSVEQLETALKAPEEDWYERLVDQLLASPQFGVRFARHWLDLVRYAESRGHEFDEDSPGARHYRDYVVRAFNDDLPYDQFLTEQIAGDLIEPRSNVEGWNESVLGTGFWFMGEWVHSPVDSRKDESDRFDNMVDVFSKTFQGLTLACARCHDHKFDAISTSDYYALYGYLRSSHFRLVRFESELPHRQQAAKLAAIRARQGVRSLELMKAIVARVNQASSLEFRQSFLNRSKSESQQGLPLPPEDVRLRVNYQLPETRLRQDGVAFGEEPKAPGSLAWNGFSKTKRGRITPWNEAQYDPFWHRLEFDETSTNRQNRYTQLQEAGRTLATDTFALTSNQLSYLIRGSVRAFVEVDSMRLISGPLHGEVLQDFGTDKPDQYRWVQHRLDRYQGKRVRVEFSPLDDQGLAIVQVADGVVTTDVAKQDEANIAESDSWDQRWRAMQCWCLGGASGDAFDDLQTAGDLEYLFEHLSDFLPSDDPLVMAWNKTRAEWEDEEKAIAAQTRWRSQVAMAMADGNGENDVLMIRGNPNNTGPVIPRRYLQALTSFVGEGLELAPTERSGRLELAKCLTDHQNPLTARVLVNRLWHHLLGRGIVPTTDDFGVLGQRPSHPELLDHLAMQLVENQWSMKKLIRTLVCSSTYRMSSDQQAIDRERDPSNIWLARARVRRLEGEAIRDTLLSVSGKLDFSLTSMSVPVHLTDFLQGRGRPGLSGPVDGLGRRSLYLSIRRNFLPPMLTVFDLPSPFSSMGRRNVSNVPAQSLMMLNDPMIHGLAKEWGDQIAKASGTHQNKLQRLYLACLGRMPSDDEWQVADRYIVEAITNASESDAWEQVIHVLFNSKELIYRF